MNKHTQIIDHIRQHCVTTGLQVEVDRRLMVSQDDDFPLIVVRTGSLANAVPSGSGRARSQMWRMRWTARPVIEVYIDNHDSLALRNEYERIFEAIMDAFEQGPILGMLTQDDPPDVEMEVIEPGEASDIGLMMITFGLTFDR